MFRCRCVPCDFFFAGGVHEVWWGLNRSLVYWPFRRRYEVKLIRCFSVTKKWTIFLRQGYHLGLREEPQIMCVLHSPWSNVIYLHCLGIKDCSASRSCTRLLVFQYHVIEGLLSYLLEKLSRGLLGNENPILIYSRDLFIRPIIPSFYYQGD